MWAELHMPASLSYVHLPRKVSTHPSPPRRQMWPQGGCSDRISRYRLMLPASSFVWFNIFPCSFLSASTGAQIRISSPQQMQPSPLNSHCIHCLRLSRFCTDIVCMPSMSLGMHRDNSLLREECITPVTHTCGIKHLQRSSPGLWLNVCSATEAVMPNCCMLGFKTLMRPSGVQKLVLTVDGSLRNM